MQIAQKIAIFSATYSSSFYRPPNASSREGSPLSQIYLLSFLKHIIFCYRLQHPHGLLSLKNRPPPQGCIAVGGGGMAAVE